MAAEIEGTDLGEKIRNKSLDCEVCGAGQLGGDVKTTSMKKSEGLGELQSKFLMWHLMPRDYMGLASIEERRWSELSPGML